MTTSLQDQVQHALGDAHLLERELGGGGMSRVFLAHERALGRKVVVKVLLPELSAGVNVERFRREIQLAAQLQHPHIVPLLSAGEAQGLPYFIMPFVSGESLRTRISRQGEFPVPESLRILRDLVSALSYAHTNGVVHRDIKPENVLLSGGVAVVTDFGVAKAVTASAGPVGATGLTSLGVALGTPAYMAPEQATASPQVDHRADIYSLGIVAYEMLSGFPPFHGRSAQAMLAAHVVEEPEPLERRRPSVPPMLAMLIKGCLAKRPAERPQSAAELLHALDAITTPSGGTAATTAVRVPVAERSTSRPRRGLIAAAGAGVAVLIAGAVLWSHRSSPPVSAGAVIATPLPPPRSPSPSVAPDTSSEAAEPPPQVPSPPSSRIRGTASSSAAQPKPRNLPLRPAPVAVPAPALAESTDSPTPDTPAAPAEVEPAAVAPVPQRATDSLPRPAAPAPPAPVPPAAPVQPLDVRPAVLSAVSDYARAIESKNLGDLRRVFPAMNGMQQRGWEQFFQLVRELKADLTAQNLKIAGDAADAQITGTYTYLNTSTGRQERQPVSFRASFKKQGAAWRIVQIR